MSSMPDLLPISIEEMIQEVERELMLRRKLYPYWIQTKKMKQASAERQIARMQAVLATLQATTGPGTE